jgi:hypothetical protein
MKAEDTILLRMKDSNNWKIGDPDKPCGIAMIYAVCPEKQCYAIAEIDAKRRKSDSITLHEISYPSTWSEVRNILRNYIPQEYDVLDLLEIKSDPREALSRAINCYVRLYNERRKGK